MVGKTISHYRVLRHVGNGGMGVVYEAEDLILRRHVALKFLTAGRNRAQSLHRFEREARAASALDHPHICTIHDFVEHEGERFIVMELLHGESLRDCLKRGPLDVPRIVALATQVTDALEAAHGAGIIHRDLTPSNIFITTRGDAKILDFGLAKFARGSEDGQLAPEESTATAEDTLTSPGAVMGTVAYMSPEQVRGDALDHRTDLFSMGAILYEMATGQRAFSGKSSVLIFDAILHEELPPVTRRGVPPEFAHIVQKALEKDAELRYQSAAELKSDLVRLQRGAAPHTRERRSRGVAPRWARIVGLLTVIAAAGAGAYWRGSTRDSETAALAPRQVTSGGGLETDPALSPDGSTIAYTSDESGSQDIWLVDVHGGPPQRLTTSDANESHPTWFPDGSSLAYVSDRDGTRSVYRAPRLDGSAATLLVRDADLPAVSPDGEKIAFVRLTADGYRHVAVARVDGSAQRVLTGPQEGHWDHVHPAWSPDSRTIAYSARDGIWVVPADLGRARKLATSVEGDRDPAWSSDGRFIYFVSSREGRAALWRSQEDGTSPPERLTLGTGAEHNPTVRRDGRALAFSNSEGSVDVQLVTIASGERVSFGSTRDENFPVFAPDGWRLYFLSNRWGDHDVWTQQLEADGAPEGPARRLASQPGIESNLACSADGRQIAYHRVLNGRRDIMILSSDGGEPRPLTTDGHSMQPSWSPDGSRITYLSARGGIEQVFVQALDETAPRGPAARITDEPSVHFSPVWSPDGARLAFITQGDRLDTLDIVTLNGGGRRRVPLNGRAARVRWHAGLGLLFVAGRWETRDIQLRALHPDGTPAGTPGAIFLGRDVSSVSFDISPDGRRLTTPARQTSGNIWLLESSTRRF